MKIERRKIWWLSDPKRRRAGPSGLKTSTTSPLCPTLRIRSLSSTVVEFGRSSSRAPIFSPPSVSRARIFCSAWSRVCVLLFNNTGSPCACLRACVSLCIGGRSCAMIFYDRVAVPQSPQLAIPFYRCNKVIFLSLSHSLDIIYVYII